jgi:pimeloyl-ACP methyl ester carboxylesterase
VPVAAVNGARLYFERHGGGEPLLLVTGFAISAAVFEPVLERYAERFDCIVYDNRGAGRTRAPRRLASMPGLAADAAGLLDALDVPSAHVLGISMGGMVAQELALRFPQRVRGLILGGTSPGGPRAARPALGELAALGSALAARRRDWLAHALFSPEFRSGHPAEVARLLEPFARHRPPPDGVLAHWWASVYHDTTARLGRIQAPTLVMHGERDTLAPVANARLLAARIPDAELALVPGAGHAYALERPELSFRLLTEWLDRRAPIAPGAPRRGVLARAEPWTRPFGLPVGMARTGGSLAAMVSERIVTRERRRDAHVAVDR